MTEQPSRPNYARALHALVARDHPELFSLENPRPFKIGIRQDFKAKYPDVPDRAVKDLFSWLCSRRAYLVVCIEGEPRWGFAGKDGEVNAEQARCSRERFKMRNDRAADKWTLTPVAAP